MKLLLDTHAFLCFFGSTIVLSHGLQEKTSIALCLKMNRRHRAILEIEVVGHTCYADR